MTLKINKRTLSELILLVIVFLSSSFVVTNDILDSTIVIILWISTFLLLLFGIYNYKIDVSVSLFSPLIVITTLILCMWITDIVNGENLLTSAKNSFAFATVSLMTYFVSFDEFKVSYVNVIKMLSLISLACLLLYQLFPVLNNFNVVNNLNGMPYSCLYLYISSPSMIRNMGMFWEPGAYGSFLCLALVFEITNKEVNTKNLVIILVAIISTFSTTAYIATIMIVFYALVLRFDMNKKTKIILLLLSLLSVIGIFANYDLFFGKYGASTVFGKLLRYFEGTSHSQYTSTSIRFNAIKYSLLAYFKKPFFGFGYSGLYNYLFKYTLGRNTCTFANWFSVYGSLFGLVMTTGYYEFCKKVSGTMIQRLILIMILFVIIVSENYVNNSFFIMICLYGFYYDKTHRNEMEVELKNV